jgi:CBS domain-containing protein
VTHDLLGLLAGDEEVGRLVNAWDLSRHNPPMLTLESNLDQAAQMMEYEGLDELPVVDAANGGRLAGLVARHDIARTFSRVSLSVSALATQEDNIFWASGYRVSRMPVPEQAVGKTLRELDTRRRFGVSVLAVRDSADMEAGFEPSLPDRPFLAGDLIIAAGHPADLRRFTRELAQVSAATPPLEGGESSRDR